MRCRKMREQIITCDFCGKLLLPTHNAMPDYKTHTESLKMTYLYDDREMDFDICPRCLKRMKKYLERQAKIEGD